MITFPTITDERGKLTVIERLPFAIRRVYYLHGCTPDAQRGGHAHRKLRRILVAIAGGFSVSLDGGPKFSLRDPGVGLPVLPMQWLELADFSPGAICLVLASAEYEAADYIRDRIEWEALRGTQARAAA